MKIIFECLGFATNPCFLLDTENDDARPLPYGTVCTMPSKEGELEYWRENYYDHPDGVTEEQVLAAYKEQFSEHGVVINDVSKEAWLEERFGEPKEKT
jgi:hypothetical protein|tara:strand:- start:12 stop:305 length:294 start_codon:yes stop_codon:yes gene_type:complete